MFARGQWTELLILSREWPSDDGECSPEKRAERAQMLVLMGEVSAGRQALQQSQQGRRLL